MPKNLIEVKDFTKESKPGKYYSPGLLIGNPRQASTFADVDSVISTITVVRYDDVSAAHWEVFLKSDGGVLTKVDLLASGYRVLYGVTMRLLDTATTEEIKLDRKLVLADVIFVMSEIAEKKGEWTGTDDYNCQDFTLLLMAGLGLPASAIFKYELRRTVTKHRPPAVTDQDEKKKIRTRW
jgi:hypothetical protein